MRPVEVGAIALGLITVLSGACSKGGSSSQGSKAPSASNQAPAQAPQAQQQPKSQTPAIGGGPTEPGAAPAPITPKGAVSRITAAECDHEVQCNNVGQNKAYKTLDDCIAKTQREKRKGINDKVCTGGINQGNLNGCVQALRSEECGNPISALSRLEACKTDSICEKKKK